MNSIKTPNSSAIKEVGFDKNTNLLEVSFVSGKSYIYVGVPQTIVDKFEKAESKGKFFLKNVKGRYAYTMAL